MEYDAGQVTAGMIQKQAAFKGKTVLEIGCGEGEISSLLAHGTKLYTGIDPDEKAIRKAKKTYDNVDFRIGNGESLEFGDSFFDLMLFTLSLHHQNSCAALKEAFRVLKNNGKLIILEPSIKGELQQFFHLFDDETQKIQNAYHCMMNCSFVLENNDSFEAIARFDNKTDLCSYDFNREKIALGDEIRILRQLEQLQPGGSNQSPIILKDMLDIYLMTKA